MTISKRSTSIPVRNKQEKLGVLENTRNEEILEEIRKTSFEDFFNVWADQQGWKVPDFHYQIIRFLSDSKNWQQDIGLLQVFRGGGKSTISCLFIVWLLVKDPTLRILLMSSDDTSTVGFVRDSRSIILRHPLAKHLYNPKNMWGEHRFFVEGHVDGRIPSLMARSLNSNVTSLRSDFIIYDDIEAAGNVATDGLREKLRTRLRETYHLLVPGGHKLFIGTPHTRETIYDEVKNSGCSALFLPFYANPEGEFPLVQGKGLWDDYFTPRKMLEKQAEPGMTKGNFLSQFQLLPVLIEDAILDLTLATVYDEEPEFFLSQGRTHANLCGMKMGGVTAYWDPSTSKANRDDSVVALVYSSDTGHYFIHRTFCLKGDLEEQLDELKKHIKKHRISNLIIESNGIGAFIPQMALKKLSGMNCGIDSHFTQQNKQEKIVEAYEGPLSAKVIHIHQKVMAGKLPDQITEFSPKLKNQKDDYIDSSASAILAEPVRIANIMDDNKGNGFTPFGMGQNDDDYEVDHFDLS